MRAYVPVAALLVAALPAVAAEPPARIRLHNLKILSDHIDDVSTPENILASFVKPGMSDAERALALWKVSVRYRHQTAPPNEYLAADWDVHDPVKLFNVYGYCMCCCSSSLIEALNRLDGREARGRILNGHSVSEVRYGNGWHMCDASLITYFPKADGSIASVDEISAAVRGWHVRHPGYRGNGAKLVDVMRRDGWLGWKSAGPELLATCPHYKLGYFPARTHGWDATMVEYDRKSEEYEYGYHVGHRALMSLRPGESFVREAGNRGLHVNRAEMPDWPTLKQRAPTEDLVYVKDFLPGYNGGVVANGYHRYAPDLASKDLVAGADLCENMQFRNGSLRPQVASQPAVLVVPMVSPYVYLGGRVKLKATRTTAGDTVKLSLSTNNGRTFTPLWAAEVGTPESTVDLGSRVLRRYAYWLKIELHAASENGAAFEALQIENDIQHAPRTIPWLGKGSNTISVAADRDPTLASRAIACRISPDPAFDKNESTTTLGVTFDNLDVRDGGCWWKGGIGTMTVPIETPGDLAALRFSAQIRARGAKDLIKMLVSFDGGTSWREAARMAGPTPGRTGAFRFGDVPQSTRKALFRFEMSGNNTAGVFNFRIDADYRDPKATTFRPFEVVHRWKEGGEEKTHRERIPRLPHCYRIDTGGEPEMVSVTCGMPVKEATR